MDLHGREGGPETNYSLMMDDTAFDCMVINKQ